MNRDSSEKGYLFEFIVLGNAQKASILDPETLIEVSIVASPQAPRDHLKKILLQKLKMRIAQN